MFLMAKPFGMRHLGCDPRLSEKDVADVDVELVDMDTLLAESDFVSISVPLSEQTRHLIGEREIELDEADGVPDQYFPGTRRR